MLSLTMKQKLFTPLPFVEKQEEYMKYQLLNLYFSFYLFENLIQNNEFSGEIFVLYFILLERVVFLVLII